MKNPIAQTEELSFATRPLNISPKKITRFLVVSIFLLLLGHIAAFIENYVRHAYSRTAKNIIRWFDFNLENNVPTWFSVLILAFAAILLLVIYLHKKNIGSKDALYWLMLGFIFIFLSMDESVGVHEEVAEILRPKLGDNASSIFHWAWVIPYGIAVIAFGLYFLRFVLSLPKQTRNLFILSGAMFLTGALGLEFIEGYLYVHYGLDHIYNRILYCIEELCEMGGVTLFIYALLNYMETNKVSINITTTHR